MLNSPVGILALAGTLCAAGACAQDYPVKPIRMIIPFVPGGANDVFGRLVGAKLTEAHGQQVIVENRGGAGGSLGMELAAKAPPDGYTLVLGNIANLSVNPAIYRKLGYNPLTDLQPITLLARLPSILVVHPSLPARNIRELITLARSQPARLTFGTGGGGSGSHLTMELFKQQAKIELVHIPYKGVGPAMIDLLAGQITMAFGAVPGAGPYVRNGRLRGLGVSSAERIPAYPDIPTIAQAGLPGFEATLWYGVLAPAGTPMPIVNRLHATITRALQTPDMKQRFVAEGAEPAGSTPQAFQAFIKSEMERWAVVVQAAGMRPE